jgi:opacity protein-like surface antigen
MTRVRISLVAAFAAFVMVLPQPALAQNGAGELSAGWRVLNIEEETFLAGWYADVVGNITNTFGVVAEVAGHYKTFDETRSVGAIQVAVSADARVHTFMGGVRFSLPQNPRITPFVQALVGLAHAAVDAETSSNLGGTFTFDESTSDAAIDLGGGVNIGLTDSMRLRLAGSYVRVLEEDAGNGVRFAVGIVFPF